MRCLTNPPSWTSSSPPFWRDAVGLVWSTAGGFALGHRALAAFAFAHVVLQGQQGPPVGVGPCTATTCSPDAVVSALATHQPALCQRVEEVDILGSCKTMGCAELAMARSSLVSMVNFHWPLVRAAKLKSKACCQGAQEARVHLRASCGNECVKRILIVNCWAAPGLAPGATGVRQGLCQIHQRSSSGMPAQVYSAA